MCKQLERKARPSKGDQSALLGRRTRVDKRGPCDAGTVCDSGQAESLVLVEESSSAKSRCYGAERNWKLQLGFHESVNIILGDSKLVKL
jgi:hypothetical protein